MNIYRNAQFCDENGVFELNYKESWAFQLRRGLPF